MRRGLDLKELDPNTLRLFIIAYWPQVSKLAHEIHDAEDVMDHLESQKN